MRSVFCSSLAISFLRFALASAAQKEAPPALIPAQIVAAKKIFIANAGGEQGSYPDPAFNGGQDRAFNSFYAAVKSWGRYELVRAPADADLLVEIGVADLKKLDADSAAQLPDSK